MIRYTILILLLLVLVRCEEPVDLDFKNNPPAYLVVEGNITTEPGIHRVIISRATPFVNGEVTPKTNESVGNMRIEDDLGNTIRLDEVDQGVYETPANFSASEGRAYQLRFTTADGNDYSSKPQRVYEKGTLRDVHAAYDVRQVYNPAADQFVDQGIIEFRADYSFSTESPYVAFDYTGTFLMSDLSSSTCYVNDEANGIAALRSSVNFIDKSVNDDNLFYINHDFRFRDTYSLNLKMYTVDRDAYRFLSDAQQQLQTSGSIFDPAPRQIIGNLYNEADDSETVLGFFGVYNVVERRVFINESDIPVPRPFNICSRIEGPGTPPVFCFDCSRYFGSTKIKPPFWP